MRAGEAPGRVEGWVGTAVAVEGWLAVAGVGEALVTPGCEADQRGERLRVGGGGAIEEYLLGTLAVYVGGPCSYFEECVVTGTVARRDGGFELSDVRRCRVWRGRRVIEVPCGGGPASA